MRGDAFAYDISDTAHCGGGAYDIDISDTAHCGGGGGAGVDHSDIAERKEEARAKERCEMRAEQSAWCRESWRCEPVIGRPLTGVNRAPRLRRLATVVRHRSRQVRLYGGVPL